MGRTWWFACGARFPSCRCSDQPQTAMHATSSLRVFMEILTWRPWSKGTRRSQACFRPGRSMITDVVGRGHHFERSGTMHRIRWKSATPIAMRG